MGCDKCVRRAGMHQLSPLSLPVPRALPACRSPQAACHTGTHNSSRLCPSMLSGICGPRLGTHQTVVRAELPRPKHPMRNAPDALCEHQSSVAAAAPHKAIQCASIRVDRATVRLCVCAGGPRGGSAESSPLVRAPTPRLGGARPCPLSRTAGGSSALLSPLERATLTPGCARSP